MARRATTVGALTFWCFLIWLALTGLLTVEAVAVGLGVSLLVAWSLAPLGPVARPWRMVSMLRLTGFVAYKVVRANFSLARRIWTPSLPLATGMVIVRTRFGDEGRVAAVGIVSSLIVDNQIVDLDRSRHELVYHCIAVPAEGRRYDEINGPLERRIAALTRAGDANGTPGTPGNAAGGGNDGAGGGDGGSGGGGEGDG
ncbi:Na+/H+ antiporter subunit E [Kribbella sp. NPDC004536]|uniref:Na+/H+ antiporter subunit E n=1 Tax=Kribbella sp. NPDC004536 TaxID=3364106 RepID=UPI0036BAAF17